MMRFGLLIACACLLFAGCSQTAPTVIEDTWTVAQATREGHPAICRFRENATVNVDTTVYPRMVVIAWEFDGSENNGFPSLETNQQQQQFEELLDPLDVPELGIHTHVVTCNGGKEWVWYVKDSDAWMAKFNEALAGQAAMPIKISFYDEPGWRTYHGFMNWINQ